MKDNRIATSDIQVASNEPKSATDRHDDDYIERQTRTRKVFSLPQIFFFSVMYFGTWQGMGSSMWYALNNGGPAAYLFNFIIVMIGALAQASVLGELASIMPLAGAQYYWTYAFAPPKYRRFLTWIQGWATWLGYVSTLAGALNSLSLGYEGAILMNFPNYVNGGWRTMMFVFAQLALFTIMNMWLFKTIPWLELGSGILNVCLFLIVFISLWVTAPKNDPSFMLTTYKDSGYDSDFVSWNVGMLTHVWMFIGFECAVHMGEDTKNARRAAPMAMVWSMVFSSIMAFLIIITYLMCMPPLEEMLDAAFPVYYLYEKAIGIPAVSTTIVTGLALCKIGGGVTVFSSTSRITWAWARDGGLPAYFGYVDSKHRVPLRAVLLTCVIVALLALLNLGKGGFIALGAISSLSSFSLYFTYAILLGIILHVRLTKGLPEAEWSLGKFGLPVTVFALVYTLYTMIWLPFPESIPVDAASFNYAGPVFVVVMAGAIGAWFAWAKDNWSGPNEAVVNVVLKKAADKY